MYSSIKSKEDEASSTEEDWEADEKEETLEDKKEAKTKSPKVRQMFLYTLKTTAT